MTKERRQYTWLKSVVLGSGVMTLMVLTVTSVRLWPTLGRTLFQSKLQCGCAVVAIHPSWWVTGASGALIALTIVMLVRFGWTFIRHLRHSRRYLTRLTGRGGRAILHHPTHTVITVVNLAEPLAVTLGLFRPRIYLSQGLLRRLTASEVSSVIAHEREHQRAADPLVTATLDSVLNACPWFPGARQVMAAAYSLREVSADADATNGYRTVTALSSAFVKLSELNSEPSLSAFSPNRDRLEKLLDRNWSAPRRWWSWTAALIISLAFLSAVTISRAARAAAPTVPQTAALCHETIVMCRDEQRPVSQLGWLCLSGLCSAVDQPWSSRYAITLVR